MKLLIRNLSRTTTEADLQNMFADYGRVQSCSLILDKDTGTSKGFAFVDMPKQGEARVAMKALNGKELDGSKIRVKKAEAKAESEVTAKSVEPKSNKSNKQVSTKDSIWTKRTK